MIAAYRSGETVRLIGTRHGVTRETVFNVLRRNDIPRRRRVGPKRKEFSAEELSRMAELRRSGMSKEELQDEFHAGLERLERALKSLGLNGRMRRRDGLDRIESTGGYVYVLVPRDDPMRIMAGRAASGYVLEHRLVMARSLGRVLRQDETVHHINGDRKDNRLENLQVRQGKHGSGVAMTCNNCGSHDIAHVPLAG